MSLDLLTAMARALGGDIREDDWLDYPDTPPSIAACPFDQHLAIDHERKRVLYRGQPGLGGIPHEMGHVFASTKAPRDSEEWEFFGWEYLIAKRAGVAAEWFASSMTYQIPRGTDGFRRKRLVDFGALPVREQRSVLAERIRFARRNGTIRRGNPVSIRTTAKENR